MPTEVSGISHSHRASLALADSSIALSSSPSSVVGPLSFMSPSFSARSRSCVPSLPPRGDLFRLAASGVFRDRSLGIISRFASGTSRWFRGFGCPVEASGSFA